MATNKYLKAYLALDGQHVPGAQLAKLRQELLVAALQGKLKGIPPAQVQTMLDNLARGIQAAGTGRITIHIPNAASLGKPAGKVKRKAPKLKVADESGRGKSYPLTTYTGKKRDHTPASGGRAQQWHAARGGIPVVLKKAMKDSTRIPQVFRDNLFNEDYLLKYFGLRNIEFGNWLSQADRYNYMGGAALALYDIKLLLDFSGLQTGLDGKLGLSFGARGFGRALAHFEPNTFVINLTRYSRVAARATHWNQQVRTDAMHSDGGSSSLGHEYGHALDYYIGTFVEKSPANCLSGGNRRFAKPDNAVIASGSMRGMMEALLHKIVNNEDGSRSKYYARLVAAVGEDNGYWFRRNELFARAFEVYLAYKLKKRGLQNTYLTKRKYGKECYLTDNELRAVEPLFDKLMAAMRRAIHAKK